MEIKSFKQLDTQDRLAVIAMDTNGATHKEISEALGIKVKSISYALNKQNKEHYTPLLHERIEKIAAYIAKRYPNGLGNKDAVEQMGMASGSELRKVLDTQKLPDLTPYSVARYIVFYT
jgi:hypothetical protein